MIEDELIKIWQSSPAQEQIKFEKSRLMVDVQSNLDNLQKELKTVQRRNIIAAIIVIPVFCYYVYAIPYIITQIASVLLILFGIYSRVRFNRPKKYIPRNFNGTYLEYLYQYRTYFQQLKKQWDNMLYWYFIPFTCMAIMFSLGFIEAPDKSIYDVLKGPVLFIVACVIMNLMSKRWFKKTTVPTIERVEELIEEMEKQ